ncbi:hypothetical protein [Methanobrevibacter sp.]|uniref:hypothetical protein n=1 Tax=Methanobrevibacter sp. TaxID=66852 RepID=UPI0038646226
MAEKCNPKYKNLQLISSFSEQRYATVQLMEQICMNDEYLKQYCDDLDYLSPPAVRKRFNITENIDENKSYGFQLNSNKTVTFNNKDKTVIDIDFFDESLLDMSVSDCEIQSSENNEGEPVKYVRLPYVVTSSTTDTDSTKNLPETGGKVSSYWYVGYDKSKTYTLYPEWMRNWKDFKIPSVVRAQTFKCNKTGVLEAVSLDIATDSKYSSWGSPIYVQIWPTKVRKNVQVSKWNHKLKIGEPVYITAPAGTTAQKYRKIASGKNKGKWKKDNVNGTHIRQTEDLIKPKSKLSNGSSMTYHALAEASFDPKFSTPGFHTFTFDNPCNVVKDKYYAIVVFSPLSHWGQAPRIGGWTRRSSHDYPDGNAFISENNGRTFMKYGKKDPDTKLKYKMGKYEPQDFAFQCQITSYTKGYQPLVTKNADGEDVTAYNYLYLKPIFTNPINSIEINATDTGTTTVDHNAGRYLEYQYSLTGNRLNDDEWVTLPKANRSAISGKPTMIFVRAKMWQTSTNNTQTPSIEYMRVILETDVAKEMYVRTQTYYPKTTPMLGANIWGRIHAPFECETDEVKCGAEIIQEKIIKEHFEIITVDDLEDYTYMDEIDEDKIKGLNSDELCQYLVDNQNIIKALKKNNIYVKPYIYEAEEDDGDDTIEYLSFKDTDSTGAFKLGGFQFTNSPSYPIISCKTLPTGGVDQAYGEWFDYKVDYDKDTLTFTEHNLLNMPVGGLEVEYNKLFIDNLQPSELPLVLDYFKEEFLISDQEIEDKYVTIRVDATDPIRHVFVNKDTDNEIELIEDEDFTVDYINNRVHFLVINKDDDKAKIKLNDTVTIVYTPNLDDTGISIGYYAKRPDSALKRQCKIYPNYIEYKV